MLVPTEFTARDAKAVRQAVDLALVFRAKLTLLHVIDINDPAWLRFSGASDELMRLLRTKAHADMDRLRESLAGRGVDLEFVIVEGMPWEEILLRAECFDLVIMSRPRPRSFWRFFSRQTAKRVIDQAECGIWVVPD